MNFAPIQLLIAMSSIQIGASYAKSLFPIVGAPGATFLRLFIASILLLILFRPWRNLPNKNQLKKILKYGTVLGLMNMLFYLSLERIPLGVAVALEFTGPLSVAIFSSRKIFDFIWAVLAASGIFILLPFTQNITHLDPIGVAFALGAGLCWAFYIIFGQKTGEDIDQKIICSIGMMFATLAALPFCIGSIGMNVFSKKVLLISLIVAVFSSALPYTLEMYALKKIPRYLFSILMSLEPVIATVVGIFLLKEKLLVNQYIAIALIVSASLGSTLTIKRKPELLMNE